MTSAQLAFLGMLEVKPNPVTRKDMPLADYAEDRIRQSCRRAGWATWGGAPAGWSITQSGRDAVTAAISSGKQSAP